MRLYLLCVWYNRLTLVGFTSFALVMLLETTLQLPFITIYCIAFIPCMLLGMTLFGLDSYRTARRTLRVWRSGRDMLFVSGLNAIPISQ